jgi:transcriptional regulator with XRE-family HTH domain
MTQEQLGVASGLPQTTISKYEKGKAVPNLKTLLKLATGLQVRLETLVEGVDVKFDAFYQGLRVSIRTNDEEEESGADLAGDTLPFNVIIPGAPPVGDSNDGQAPTLEQTHKELQKLISGLISISGRLAAGPPPVARDVGPPIHPRGSRTRKRTSRKAPQTDRQEKRR